MNEGGYKCPDLTKSCRQLISESADLVQAGDICASTLDDCPITSISFVSLEEYTQAGHIGENNLADALGTHVGQKGTAMHMRGAGQQFKEGRHHLAPDA